MPSRRNFNGTSTAHGGDQVALGDGLVEAVDVGRDTVFEVEQSVGVAVDLSLGVAVNPTSSESKQSKIAPYFW